jgi:hypothetical protein
MTGSVRPLTAIDARRAAASGGWVSQRVAAKSSAYETIGGAGKVFGTGDVAAAMTSWIVGLLGIIADLTILLALVAAVASPRLSEVARPLIATFAFTCAWLLTAGFDVFRAPGWTTGLGCAVVALSVVVITVTLHRWTQEGVGGESRSGLQGDEGGGGPRCRRPDGPLPRGGGSEPSWWPEFERQFALYAAEGKSVKRKPARHAIEAHPDDRGRFSAGDSAHG